MPRRLPHYLRSKRKHAAFSQADIAALQGLRTHAKVSRYENSRRLPPLRTALAYEAIFGVPVSDLFGGLFDSIRSDVRTRARRLAEDAGHLPPTPRRTRRKESLQRIAAA